MAVTIANREILYRGTYTLMYVEITMDSSYATAGESISATDFGFSVIKGLWPSVTGGYVVDAVRSSDTAFLIKYWAAGPNTNTATELVSGKDLSAVTLRCMILGR